jgi:WD40 repeat protein
MSESRQERIRDVHARALEVPPEELAAWLDEACGADGELRREIESLLRARERMGSFLEDPAAERLGIELPPMPAFESGHRVGDYEIVRLLGSGGAGTVYEAIQSRPHRRVALKVLRAETEERGWTWDEAEILAELKHPDVAHVYEAGVHEHAGARFPYIAMEFVEGARTVLAHAREEGLSVRARLALVARIADAVHHGHQKGIIHRDLKPGNLLVDATGKPKVIDFGIARASGTEEPRETGLVGTLAYMSPERLVRGDDGDDVRSDVYALGVLLFELLAGRLPHDLDGLPLAEAIRRIRDEPPTSLAAVDSRFRGDLDAIVGKALASRREERYGSAAALANDLRRHLAHRPVEARSPRLHYLIGRAVRRHRLAAAALLILVVVSVAAAVVSWRLAVRSRRYAREAEGQRVAAELGRAEAEWQAYVASIGAAEAALRVHDVAEARRALDGAPEALRGWEWRHLDGRVDRSLRTLWRPHASWRQCMGALGPDGRLLATVRADMRLGRRYELWESATGKLLHGLAADPAQENIDCLAFSPDGDRIAEGLRGGSIRLRDVSTWRVVHVLEGHGPYVVGVAFSPCGRWLASGSRDRTVRLWSASDGRIVRVLEGHEDRIIGLAFSPDGNFLVSGGREGAIRVWDVSTGETVRVLTGHEGSVESVAVGPDGRRVASCSRDRTVRVWDLATGRELARGRGHRQNVRGVAFSPDGRRVASGSYDHTVRIWDAETGRETATLCGHTSLVKGVTFSADGSRLITWGEDGFKEWTARDEEEVPTLRGHADRIHHLAFRADGKRLASASADGTVRIWDPETGRTVATLGDHPGAVRAVRFLFGGSQVLTVGEFTELRFWNPPYERPRCVQTASFAYAVAEGPERKRLFLSTGSREHLEIRDVSTGAPLHRLQCGRRRVTCLTLTPDGRVATGSYDGVVRILDPSTLEPLAEAKASTNSILAVALEPDGKRVVVSGWDNTLRVLDAHTLTPLRDLTGHTKVVTCLAISPDGLRYASGSADGTIRLWDAPTGRCVAVLRGHNQVVGALAFSPDGRRLASGTGDWEVPGVIKLWEVPADGGE